MSLFNVNAIVTGSASPGFLADAVNKLLLYRTPKQIVDFIKSEQIKCIIGNPPFDKIIEQDAANSNAAGIMGEVVNNS